MIIDLATADQSTSSEDNSAWVVFNGEAYNFRDLRHEKGCGSRVAVQKVGPNERSWNLHKGS